MQILAVVAVLTALTPLVGGYMARVYQRERVSLTALLAPVEAITYRVLRVDPAEEQGWREYARSVLLFSAGSWLLQLLPVQKPSRTTLAA